MGTVLLGACFLVLASGAVPIAAPAERAHGHRPAQQRGAAAGLPKELARSLAQFRKAEPRDAPRALQTVLEAEQRASSTFVERARELSTREQALQEIEAVDAALASRIRAALPVTKTAEREVAEALAPWFGLWLAKPCSRELQARLGELEDDCRAAQRSILAAAPADAPDAWRRKEASVAAWSAAKTPALAAIFDTESYPDADHGAAGQAAVDARVKVAWNAYTSLAGTAETDLKALMRRKPEDWHRLVERLADARKALGECRDLLAGRAGIRVAVPGEDCGDPDDPRFAKGRAHFARGLVLAFAGRSEEARPWLEHGGPYGLELARLARGQLVLDGNQAEFEARKPRGDPEEARVERLINEYRLSLGLEPLEHDARLYAAARGHSEEEARLGYYGHESPVPEHKSWADRAKLAGYPDAGVSECIFQCGKVETGRTVFMGWYGSSPHHRLLLAPDDQAIGVGRSGKFYTANFGRVRAAPR